MPLLQCISPIDGSIYAARRALSGTDAKNAIKCARNAQKDWSLTSLETRVSVVMDGIAALGQMTDEVVPELAWQMGRPVR